MASTQSVQIDHFPESIDDFKALRNTPARTPEGGAAMMVVALLAHAHSEELGRQCLTVAVDRDRLQKGHDGYKGWQLRPVDLRLVSSQITSMPYLPWSYVAGATPENGYQHPAPPYEVAVSPAPYGGEPQSGKAKVVVACSGAASPRPVMLQRTLRGIWKAIEWSSLLVGVQRPVREEEDDL